MLGWLKNLLFGKKEITILCKRVAYNGFRTVVSNREGVYELVDFTGHLSFDKDTECDVENASLDIVIERPEFIEDNTMDNEIDSTNFNRIYWHDGTVVRGNLHCHTFENGFFNGRSLIVKGKMHGEFHGVFMSENSLY